MVVVVEEQVPPNAGNMTGRSASRDGGPVPWRKIVDSDLVLSRPAVGLQLKRNSNSDDHLFLIPSSRSTCKPCPTKLLELLSSMRIAASPSDVRRSAGRCVALSIDNVSRVLSIGMKSCPVVKMGM